MRVLLDECLPKDLKHDIAGHETSTVAEMGWAGTKNGQLLTLSEQSFDVLVTADRNIEHQQNLRGRRIALVVLRAQDTRVETLRPLVPALLRALEAVKPGTVTSVGE